MLPLRDTVPSRSFPVVNVLLIVTNIAVFVFMLGMPEPVREAFVVAFGVVPARLMAPPAFLDAYTLLTSQFIHGGLLHLGSNMLALFIFGDNVEDRLGHLWYLLYYLVCGIAGGLFHVFIQPQSIVPAIGASGAIAGVLGGYMVLFPTARIVTLVPIFFIPWLIRVPALLWVGGWFLSQLFQGLAAIEMPAADIGGVGFWAHVGGFISGVVLVLPARLSRLRTA